MANSPDTFPQETASDTQGTALPVKPSPVSIIPPSLTDSLKSSDSAPSTDITEHSSFPPSLIQTPHHAETVPFDIEPIEANKPQAATDSTLSTTLLENTSTSSPRPSLSMQPSAVDSPTFSATLEGQSSSTTPSSLSDAAPIPHSEPGTSSSPLLASPQTPDSLLHKDPNDILTAPAIVSDTSAALSVLLVTTEAPNPEVHLPSPLSAASPGPTFDPSLHKHGSGDITITAPGIWLTTQAPPSPRASPREQPFLSMPVSPLATTTPTPALEPPILNDPLPAVAEQTAPIIRLTSQAPSSPRASPPEQPLLSVPLSPLATTTTPTLALELPILNDPLPAVSKSTTSTIAEVKTDTASAQPSLPSEPDVISTAAPSLTIDASTPISALPITTPIPSVELGTPLSSTIDSSPPSSNLGGVVDAAPIPSSVEGVTESSVLAATPVPESSAYPPPPLEQPSLSSTLAFSQSSIPETPTAATDKLVDISKTRHITVVAASDEDDGCCDDFALASAQPSLSLGSSEPLVAEESRAVPPSPNASGLFVAQVASVDTSLLAPVNPSLGPHVFPALVLSMAVTASFVSLSSWNATQGELELILSEGNAVQKEIIARCPLLYSQYEPLPLVTGRHSSTIFAAFFRTLPGLTFRRVCLRMPDGGTVALDWPVGGADWAPFQGVELPESAPLVILLPGLTGGSDDTYVRHLLLRARKHGWKTVVFNSRGCANSPVTTPQFYSASFTEDLREVVKHVASLHPSSRLYAAGWSLGANILVRYLGQEKEETPLAGAVSLCNPFDLVEADKEFQIGFNNVYNRNLAKGLRRIFQKHASLFEGLPPPYNIPLVANAQTVRDFDDGLTRVSFGYSTVNDYYSDASSSKSIPDVAIPLLCIQAEDDPIAPSVGIPRQAIAENPNVMLVVTPGGGHLGWVAGPEAPFGAPWTDPLVMQYLEAVEALASPKPPGFEAAHGDAGKAQVVDSSTLPVGGGWKRRRERGREIGAH